MKLYIAGQLRIKTAVDALRETGSRRGLYSFWDYLRDGCSMDPVFEYYRDEGEVFLDSGAFSAYTLGAEISIKEYARFIFREGLSLYSNLDVIRDEEGTRINQKVMEHMGLSPVPVFHLGETWGYLRELLERYDYISLGVAGTQGERRCDEFLRRCFREVAKAWPKRIHGFGITTQRYLERYPFYSTDSASAITAAGWGRIYFWKGKRLVSGDYKDPEVGAGNFSMVDREEGKSEHMERRKNNIRRHLELEEYITRLWEKRGVSWD